MKSFTLCLGSLVVAIVFFQLPCHAQCNAPEVVKGAGKYNMLVCQGAAAVGRGEDQKALGLFLAASKEPIFEFPNISLYGRISETYARLGQFKEADLYLKYDDISLLWLIGVVRCQEGPNMKDEGLFQDGDRLTSDEAKYMANVLCGAIFDEYSHFGDRNAASFVPAAKAILRYNALRKEIDQMRTKQSQQSTKNK